MQGRLILIVEGDQTLGAQISRDVRRHGKAAATELISDYAAARTRLNSEPTPATVVMEYRLGQHTGVDLALWMLGQQHLQETQRVLYTATPRALVAQDPALAGRTPDELFTVILQKGVGVGPGALAQALRPRRARDETQTNNTRSSASE